MSRKPLLGAVAAAATLLTAAPAANADLLVVGVCNQASPEFVGGGLTPIDPPTDSPAARYKNNLYLLPGQGDGLYTAAVNSAPLSVCVLGGIGGTV